MPDIVYRLDLLVIIYAFIKQFQIKAVHAYRLMKILQKHPYLHVDKWQVARWYWK